MSSNLRHWSGLRGAVEQVIRRSVGTSSAVIPVGSFSSMLTTVGTPAAKVMPWSRIQSKNRPCEKRRAMCMVSPVCRNGIRLRIWAEFQPKDRYSRVRSSAVSPSMSSVDSPLSQ